MINQKKILLGKGNFVNQKFGFTNFEFLFWNFISHFWCFIVILNFGTNFFVFVLIICLGFWLVNSEFGYFHFKIQNFLWFVIVFYWNFLILKDYHKVGKLNHFFLQFILFAFKFLFVNFKFIIVNFHFLSINLFILYIILYYYNILSIIKIYNYKKYFLL